MLKLKPTETSSYSPDFFDRCTSLFFGFEAGHMGSDMYYDHSGVRSTIENGVVKTEPMSGVLTWEEHAKHGSVPRLSRQSFLSRIGNVSELVGKGIPIVEYGPGSMEDAHRLIEATQSKLYMPADISEGIIEQASELASTVRDCEIRPAIIDLFAGNNAPLIEEPALAALLGLTITNIRGPVPRAEPKNALVSAFNSLAKPIGIGGGYLLVSTHSEQDGERNVNLYSEKWHKRFGVNFLYRMQAELPMQDFNPDHFEYNPVWYEHCSLLAHTVRATKDQTFTMGEFGETKVYVRAGDVYHYNNSFKYKQAFFEDCAKLAGLRTIQKWQDDNGMAIYLFEVSPRLRLEISPRPSMVRESNQLAAR
jgi:uncharacterized SAM-dependent methyltransferase